MPNGTKRTIRAKYVVDTSDFALIQSFIAMASVSLFFNPREKPISRKLIHVITLARVIQMPYISEEKKPSVKGIKSKFTRAPAPLSIIVSTIFFLTATLLSSPLENDKIVYFLYKNQEEKTDYIFYNINGNKHAEKIRKKT